MISIIPNSNILTLTIPSAKMPELTEPVGCPTCPYKLQPEYQGGNITLSHKTSVPLPDVL